MMKKMLLLVALSLGCGPALAVCVEDDLKACSAAEIEALLQRNLVDYRPAQAKLLKQALIERGAANEAVHLLANGESTAVAYWAADILDTLRSTATDALVKPYATPEPTLAAYHANMYFADTGAAFALENLNRNFAKYPVPAYSWGTAVFLFGKYKFRPASAHLVESIMADNPNLADAAIASLVAIYNPPKKDIDQFGKYRDIQQYFQKLTEAGKAAKAQ